MTYCSVTKNKIRGLNMNKTTCPMCGTYNECNILQQIRNSINLIYESKGCGLKYTIVTSNNAWTILSKILNKNQIKSGVNQNGRNNL